MCLDHPGLSGFTIDYFKERCDPGYDTENSRTAQYHTFEEQIQDHTPVDHQVCLNLV